MIAVEIVLNRDTLFQAHATVLGGVSLIFIMGELSKCVSNGDLFLQGIISSVDILADGFCCNCFCGNGRLSIDPVVLFKMVLIQHLYGLPSLRRTAEEVSANNCYRWFLGYPLQNVM